MIADVAVHAIVTRLDNLQLNKSVGEFLGFREVASFYLACGSIIYRTPQSRSNGNLHLKIRLEAVSESCLQKVLSFTENPPRETGKTDHDRGQGNEAIAHSARALNATSLERHLKAAAAFPKRRRIHVDVVLDSCDIVGSIFQKRGQPN